MPRKRDLFLKKRIVIDLKKAGIPEIYHLGRLNYARAEKPLRVHHHGNAMEICFLAKGRQTYHVGGKGYTLTGNDLFITFPGERHSTGKSPEEKSVLYWVIVDLSAKRKTFFGLSKNAAEALRQGLMSVRMRHFKGKAHLGQILNQAITAYYGSTAYRTLRIQNKMVEFLLNVMGFEKENLGGMVSPKIGETLRFINDRIHEKITIGKLARIACLSESQFKAKFKKETGMPPAEYVLRQKVERAKKELGLKKRSITEVAFDLDFSSSQYFATVFKRYTGKRPRDFLPGTG